MRTSPPSPTEQAVFNKFARDYDIITDGEIGVQNANVLCNPIINSETNPELTTQTLAASLLKVKNQIKFKSATYKKADELARQMTPDEQQIYRVWSKNQKLLISIDGSEEGYKNVESILGWLRGNSVTAAHLDMALSNLINSPGVGQRIHFHPQPRQQDRSVVQGRVNHAFNEEPKPKAAAAGIQGQEFVNGRRNHAYVPPGETAKNVTAAPVDAWQRIIEIQLKDWTTPNQEARLQNEYKAGVAAGKSLRDISTSLQGMIKDRQRGR
jgi:hypothetical protein